LFPNPESEAIAVIEIVVDKVLNMNYKNLTAKVAKFFAKIAMKVNL
jgi:hypothetical protein